MKLWCRRMTDRQGAGGGTSLCICNNMYCSHALSCTPSLQNTLSVTTITEALRKGHCRPAWSCQQRTVHIWPTLRPFVATWPQADAYTSGSGWPCGPFKCQSNSSISCKHVTRRAAATDTSWLHPLLRLPSSDPCYTLSNLIPPPHLRRFLPHPALPIVGKLPTPNGACPPAPCCPCAAGRGGAPPTPPAPPVL